MIAPGEKIATLRKQGVQVIEIAADDFIRAALHIKAGWTSRACCSRGGLDFTANFIEQDLIDQALVAQSDKVYEDQDGIRGVYATITGSA